MGCALEVDATRTRRLQVVEEDADDSGLVFVEIVPEQWVTSDDDAMAHAVDASATWPPFVCECGTHNEGRDLSCHYCGAWREDADSCV